MMESYVMVYNLPVIYVCWAFITLCTNDPLWFVDLINDLKKEV